MAEENFSEILCLSRSQASLLSLSPSPTSASTGPMATNSLSSSTLVNHSLPPHRLPASRSHWTIIKPSIYHLSSLPTKPNVSTFPCTSKVSASLRTPVTGQQLLALALKDGQIHDVYVGCSAFDMYCKTCLRDEAQSLFDEIPERNIAMLNSYISNAVQSGRPKNAVVTFIEFLRDGWELNSISFCAFLNACSDASWLQPGSQLHGFIIRKGFEADVSVCNGLIDFYGKCREFESSELVFSGTHFRNDVSWCSMIAAYTQNEEEEKACLVFLQARKEDIKPTDFMISSALSACAGLAVLEFGRSVYAPILKGSSVQGSADELDHVTTMNLDTFFRPLCFSFLLRQLEDVQILGFYNYYYIIICPMDLGSNQQRCYDHRQRIFEDLEPMGLKFSQCLASSKSGW